MVFPALLLGLILYDPFFFKLCGRSGLKKKISIFCIAVEVVVYMVDDDGVVISLLIFSAVVLVGEGLRMM